MKVTPGEGYTSYENTDTGQYRVGHFVPEQEGDRPPADAPEHTRTQAFAAGMLKYNPISALTAKVYGRATGGMYGGADWDMDRYDETPDPDYSPYNEDELERTRDYPPEIFAYSDSSRETSRIMREYQEARDRDDIMAAQPVAGVLGSIAGGLTNPIYLVPVAGVTGRGVGAVAGGLRSAGTAAVGEIATEAAFHGLDLDRTRTFEESVVNVASSAIFSGVLGAAIGAVPGGAVSEITGKIKADLSDPVPAPRPSPGGDTSLGGMKTIDMVRSGEYVPDRIKNPLSKAAAELTPARLLKSESDMARAVALELGEQNILGTNRHAVETAIRHHDRQVATSMMDSQSQWKSLKARGGDPSIRNYSDFKEKVSTALRQGDTHHIPEVEAAAKSWRQNLFDPVTNRAVKSGIFKEPPKTVGAESYMPRVYNRPKINAERAEFTEHLARHYLKDPSFQLTNADEALAAAKKTVQQITGDNPLDVRKNLEIEVFGAGQKRKVTVPDHILAPYLVNDVERVARNYMREMAPQIEIANRYGNIDMKEALQAVADDWDARILAAGDDPAKVAKMTRRKKRDMRDIEAVRDRLLGRYKMPDDPASFFVRAGKTSRNLNVTRLLGGSTISSIPDLARPIFQHGFRAQAKGMYKLATSPSLRKMNKAEMQRMGVALDTVLDSRARASSELEFMPYHYSRAEQVAETLAQGNGSWYKGMNHVNGQSRWNESIKSLAGMLNQDGLLHKASNFNKHSKALRRAGIDEDMAKKIRDQYKEFGSKQDGLRFANTSDWTDVDAAYAFENAVLGETNAAIITPGALDRPLWMSSEMGKTLGQFKSFGFGSTNRNLIANIENPNIAVLEGIASQLALGAMAWAARQYIYGRGEVVEDATPEDIIWHAVQYSGSLGMLWDAAEFAKNSAGAAGLTEANPQFAQSRALNQLMGPSADSVNAMFSGARMMSGEASDWDEKAVQQMIPFQNLFYARMALGIGIEALE